MTPINYQLNVLIPVLAGILVVANKPSFVLSLFSTKQWVYSQYKVGVPLFVVATLLLLFLISSRNANNTQKKSCLELFWCTSTEVQTTETVQQNPTRNLEW